MEAHASNNWKPGHIAVMTNLDTKGNLLPLDHPLLLSLADPRRLSFLVREGLWTS